MSTLDKFIGGGAQLVKGATKFAKRTYISLGSGISVADDPANDQQVLSADGGTSVDGVASVSALKSILSSLLADKQVRPTHDANIGWRYDSSALAGVTSSDILSAKPNDLSAGSPGRHIRLSDMPTVETFADLSKLVEDTHTRVHLKEYWPGTGKGGGIFCRRTGSAPNSDSGRIVKISASVWWEREGHAGVWVVTDFGAVAGDVTKDTAAFVAMIAAKDTLPHGATMRVPAGKYLLTPGIDLGVRPFTLEGDGWSRPDTSTFGDPANFTNFTGTILSTTSAAADLFTITNLATQGNNIIGIAFFGPGTGTSWGLRANQNDAFHLKTHNLMFCNFFGGFDPGSIEEGFLHYTYALGCGGFGIFLGITGGNPNPTSTDLEYINVQNCGVGLAVANVTTVKIDGGLVQSNTVGIKVTGAISATIDIEHVENNTTGVLIDSTAGAIQHLHLRGFRGDEVLFTGSGGLAYCSFRDLDLRGQTPDFGLPGNAHNCHAEGVQTNTGALACASGGTQNTIINQGVMYFGDADANGMRSFRGVFGSPEGAVTAPIGSMCLRADGAAGTVLYVKESGTGNTGWVAAYDRAFLVAGTGTVAATGDIRSPQIGQWFQHNSDNTDTLIIGTIADKTIQIGHDLAETLGYRVGTGKRHGFYVNGVERGFVSGTQMGTAGFLVCTQGSVGAGLSPGLQLFNVTSAAAGAQQNSTSVEWVGSGWQTASGGSSHNTSFAAYVVPTQGTTTPSWKWKLIAQLDFSGTANIIAVDNLGNVFLRDNAAPLGTTATDGFTYLPKMSGTPTGVPANLPGGSIPMVVDDSGNKLWCYVGGAWKSAALT